MAVVSPLLRHRHGARPPFKLAGSAAQHWAIARRHHASAPCRQKPSCNQRWTAASSNKLYYNIGGPPDQDPPDRDTLPGEVSLCTCSHVFAGTPLQLFASLTRRAPEAVPRCVQTLGPFLFAAWRT